MLLTDSLIAFALTVALAVAWTLAFTVAGVLWQRQEIREFLASAQADEARELVLR